MNLATLICRLAEFITHLLEADPRKRGWVEFLAIGPKLKIIGGFWDSEHAIIELLNSITMLSDLTHKHKMGLAH